MKDRGIPHKDRLRNIAKIQPLVRPQKRQYTLQEHRNRKAYLYALFDERFPEAFAYIGCTEHLRYRFTAYYADDLSKQPPRLRTWLQDVGLHLSAKILAIVPLSERFRLESAMIRRCLASGHPLCNVNYQGCVLGPRPHSKTRHRPKKQSQYVSQKKYNIRAGRVTIKQHIYERNQQELRNRF